MRLNKSSKGQEHLLRIYESIKDLIEPTPPESWEAWVRLGQQLKDNTLLYKRDLS